MDDLKVYLVNLGSYNEGNTIGAWFDMPLDFDKVKEKLKLDALHEEYALHDYDNWPIDLPEYISIDELNRYYNMINDLDPDVIEVLDELISWAGGLGSACEAADNVVFYDNCDDMADVAYQIVNESGMLSGVPEDVAKYFNYERYGHDLDIEGYYVKTKSGYACFSS